MSYRVWWAPQAEQDLQRLFDVSLARAQEHDGRIDGPAAIIETIRSCAEALKRTPFTCRKAADSTFLRELVIPHDHTGYVALFDIVSSALVTIVAVRHQSEDDYH